MRRGGSLGVFVTVACLAIACEESVVGNCLTCPPPVQYKNLSIKENVLFNLQTAYNSRDIDELDKLLDADFTFFFAPGDVGGSIPGQWGRADEMLTTGRMFDPDYAGPYRCKSIQFDLDFEDGVPWVPLTPDDFPEEIWWTTTVYYDFAIDVEPDISFHPAAGAKAQFTMRNIGTESKPQWQLVELRDLGGMSTARDERLTRAVEESTWGKVKALYRDD